MEQQARSNGVQVIARAADVLRALEAEPGGLSLAEISRRVELARSTVHRIVTALQDESMVVPASPGGRYRLGPELARLAGAAGGDLRRAARPFVERLHRDVNETVDLAVLNRDRVSFMDQVAAPHRLQAVSAVGESFPAYCTANGKALLAGLPDEKLERLLPGRLPASTPNTITDRDELLADLEEVRRRGVAFDREEHTVGISAVGAPIRDAGGVVAAISIPVPSARFADREGILAEALLNACAEASAALGSGGDRKAR